MSVIDANALDTAAFVARYRALFEHSPWVVERAARRRPFDDVFGGLMQVVYDASPDDQLALIRAHPELAGKAAIDRTLTAASAAEACSAAEAAVRVRSIAALPASSGCARISAS